MRLAYVINGLGPGGAEHSLAELLPFYKEAGVRPLIVCLRRRKIGVESALRRIGCEIRFLEEGGILAQTRELHALFQSERFDLIHTTIFESDVVGRIASIGTDIPVLSSLVNTSYDPIRLGDPNVRRSTLWLTRAVDGWTARHFTTWFHAITEAVRQSAIRHLGIPAERITVVERGRSRKRLGFPSPARRREARRRLGLEPDAEVVVSVGRQEYQKGQKYLLEAAGILGPSRPRLRLLICGRKGHASNELSEIHSRLGLGERVRFMGDRSDIGTFLAAADVFVFPSLYEGLGGAMIEAMAMGLPIVASDIPALREVVADGKNARLVPRGDPNSLAEGMIQFLDDRDMAKSFGRQSARIFQERFTVELCAERMMEMYTQIVGSRPSLSTRIPTRRIVDSDLVGR